MGKSLNTFTHVVLKLSKVSPLWKFSNGNRMQVDKAGYFTLVESLSKLRKKFRLCAYLIFMPYSLKVQP